MKRVIVTLDDELVDDLKGYMKDTKSKTYAGTVKKLMILGFKYAANAQDMEVNKKLDTLVKETRYNNDLLMALIKDQK